MIEKHYSHISPLLIAKELARPERRKVEKLEK
jgi:hypothetical protein